MAAGAWGASRIAALVQIPLDEFRARFWTKQHLLSRGSADGPADLLSWPIFNRLLAQHWREPVRFRLARDGRDVDSVSYVDAGGTTPRIRPERLVDHMRCGATLAFHAIDELHDPIRTLAEAFESAFDAHTQINVYASCRARAGLDVHRDDEEVFVVQVDGSKRWRLYGFGAPGDRRSRARETAEPAFDEVLSPGDVLYVPQGCYHAALAMNAPTLHLTIGLKMDARPGPRPSFALPWSITPEGLPAGRGFRVELMRPLTRMAESGSSVDVEIGARTCRFPGAMRLVVDQLDRPIAPWMGNLVAALAPPLDEDAVRLLVAMLVKEQLAAILV
jgi:cupin superfamily protein